MRQLALLVIILFALLWVTSARALEIPSYTSPVTDLADILDEDKEVALNRRILDYRNQTGNELAVLTIPTLDGEAIEDYAARVFNKWGVGKSDKDNGVLFVMAVQEKKTRLEVGYGLEADLTDIESGRIVRRDSPMGDQFRAGDWAGGVEAVIDGVIAAIGGEYAPVKKRDEPRYLPVGFIILIILIGFAIFGAIANAIRKLGKGWIGKDPWSRKDGWTHWGSGGFGGGRGGGGFGFGGGSSGGGGASGGW